MFLGGPRLTTVFRSPKRALWFAGAVLLTAYCSVPAPEESDGAGAPVAAPSHAAKWWAKDPPAS